MTMAGPAPLFLYLVEISDPTIRAGAFDWTGMLS